ncbi:hypothetical protein BDV98DRAFT_164972 [Pterulicium gracile]|uniref:Calycin-like protein n=1 Tax=Pterulicium gracile TaxID=1884261 RepID=A0A5C3QZM5_9AGAR|nr:hypothetical protein BDV98DRAFT_164972 [Pterula gracilis]
MAAPETISILDITGKWVMNKTLSDNPDELLGLQGVGLITRKIIGVVTITQGIKHFKDENGVEHVDNDQSFAGGLASTKEERIYSNVTTEHADHLYGPMKNTSWRCPVADIEHEYLKTGWTEDTIKHGTLRTVSVSDVAKGNIKQWTADQVWGFELIEGERRYTRRIKFTGPDGEGVEIRMVHNYLGPLA